MLTSTGEEENRETAHTFRFVGGVMAANTGCGLFQAIFCYRPCATRGDCGPGLRRRGLRRRLRAACGPIRRPVRGPACAAACAGLRRLRRRLRCRCGRPCRRANLPRLRPVRRSVCGPVRQWLLRPCWHRGPLSCLFALFLPCSWCGPSCGERYWGDFYSDPPDCWDPCDGYGNYTAAVGGAAVAAAPERASAAAPADAEVAAAGEFQCCGQLQ